jgi:hypothetical protein
MRDITTPVSHNSNKGLLLIKTFICFYLVHYVVKL